MEIGHYCFGLAPSCSVLQSAPDGISRLREAGGTTNIEERNSRTKRGRLTKNTSTFFQQHIKPQANRA
jgi:hypothetical protein